MCLISGVSPPCWSNKVWTSDFGRSKASNSASLLKRIKACLILGTVSTCAPRWLEGLISESRVGRSSSTPCCWARRSTITSRAESPGGCNLICSPPIKRLDSRSSKSDRCVGSSGRQTTNMRSLDWKWSMRLHSICWAAERVFNISKSSITSRPTRKNRCRNSFIEWV